MWTGKNGKFGPFCHWPIVACCAEAEINGRKTVNARQTANRFFIAAPGRKTRLIQWSEQNDLAAKFVLFHALTVA
jgi:hypothetical protein